MDPFPSLMDSDPDLHHEQSVGEGPTVPLLHLDHWVPFSQRESPEPSLFHYQPLPYQDTTSGYAPMQPVQGPHDYTRRHEASNPPPLNLGEISTSNPTGGHHVNRAILLISLSEFPSRRDHPFGCKYAFYSATPNRATAENQPYTTGHWTIPIQGYQPIRPQPMGQPNYQPQFIPQQSGGTLTYQKFPPSQGYNQPNIAGEYNQQSGGTQHPTGPTSQNIPPPHGSTQQNQAGGHNTQNNQSGLVYTQPQAQPQPQYIPVQQSYSQQQ